LLGVKAINMKSEYSAIFKHPGYPDYWGDHRFSGEYGWEQTENDHLTNETDWTQDAPDGYRVPITDDTEAWAATKIAQNRVNKNDWGINNALADTWFVQTDSKIPDYWKNDMFNPKKSGNTMIIQDLSTKLIMSMILPSDYHLITTLKENSNNISKDTHKVDHHLLKASHSPNNSQCLISCLMKDHYLIVSEMD
jgi:hypothetical protein